MKLQSNHNATEGDWKNEIHIISAHNISGKQEKRSEKKNCRYRIYLDQQ